MRKSLKFLIPLFIFIGIFLFIGVSKTQAATIEELQAQIQSLLQQVQQLQTQLAQLQGQPTQWCHTFNVNLGYCSKGSEVGALQIVLVKEGFSVNSEEKSKSSFGDFTASAVTGFQEKYKDEILTPLGLQHGTGYVGKATRTKLNSLYGCTQPPTTPSITVLSPNGGEKWVKGEKQTVKWSSVNISPTNTVTIVLRYYFSNTYKDYEIWRTLNDGSEEIIPDFAIDLLPGAYKLQIKTTVDGVSIGDWSDAAFSIGSIVTPTSTNPFIESLSTYSGPVGTLLEIRGRNFSGFEGDLTAWVENSQGVRGLLIGEAGSSATLIKVTLKSRLCQIDTTYSGLPCPSFLDLTPDVYKIYVMAWGQKSNVLNFTITSS